MESKSKALGHPIHPMLIVFPLGLFITAVISDVLYLITDNEIFSHVAYINIAGGIIGGLLAGIFGFRDWLAIPSDTRAKTVGITHGLGNLVLVILFAISWYIRRDNVDYIPTTAAMIFSFAGLLLGTVTAWLGGEMVYRLGMAVDPGANLNAPSALTNPAPESGRQFVGVPVTGREDMLSDKDMHREDYSQRKDNASREEDMHRDASMQSEDYPHHGRPVDDPDYPREGYSREDYPRRPDDLPPDPDDPDRR